MTTKGRQRRRRRMKPVTTFTCPVCASVTETLGDRFCGKCGYRPGAES